MLKDNYFDTIKPEYDNLTKIFSRHVIIQYMDYLIDKGTPFSFMILDIDNFKTINDSYGHLVGDIVLKSVANSLTKIIEDAGGVIGRYGGDEFIFAVPNIVDYEGIWQVAYDLLKSASKLVIPDYENISISYTLGVSRFPENANSIDDLFTLADKALYRGKVKGRNCFIIYLPEKHANIELQAIREKVYSPIFIHDKIFTMLTKTEDLDKNISSTINYIGAYYLIENLCIETEKELKYQYKHPLTPKNNIKCYGYDKIESNSSASGVVVINCVNECKVKDTNPLLIELVNQGVHSTVLCKIEAYGKTFGYVRADVTSLDTGRIWQSDDLVVLECLSNYLALMFYYHENNIKMK